CLRGLRDLAVSSSRSLTVPSGRSKTLGSSGLQAGDPGTPQASRKPSSALRPPPARYTHPMRLSTPIVLTLAMVAQDWPQFRGPDGQGHATGQGFPLQWSESQHVQWKVPVPGRGWSSPVVAGARGGVAAAEKGGEGTAPRLS